LKRNLTFLAPVLSTAVFRRIWRESLEKLQDLLWTEVLMKHSFTTLGAAQFMHDVQAIVSVVERSIPSGALAMKTLEDGARVLSLPLKAESGQLSLKEVGDRFFKDNSEAKKALEDLEIDTLTPPNARNIIQKRVEYQG
jgi:RAD50-interacting protein 1